MERAHTMLGVPGRMFQVPATGPLWAHQRWVSEQRPTGTAHEYAVVEARYDDGCHNGHNTFTITGEVREQGRRDCVEGGCIHDTIARLFPELRPLIPWHLVSDDGPMHYVANTVYLASDRDYRGLRKGESKDVVGPDGVPWWELCADGAPVYRLQRTFQGLEPPPVPLVRWERQQVIGEGKARELDAARSVAVWPDATDAELCAPPEQLQAMLEARLPQLLQDFHDAMVHAGFQWRPNE